MFKKSAKILFFALIIITLILACGNPEDKKWELFNKAKELYEKGQYVEARIESKKAIKLDLQFSRAYYMLGMISVKQNNLEKAYDELSKALELEPELLDAHIEIGTVFFLLKNGEQARKKADFVLSKNSEHEGAMILLASCLIWDQKEKEAELILKSIIKKNPKKPGPYIKLAKMKQQDHDRAIQILQDLLEQEETNKAARLFLAEILEKKSDFLEAEAQYKKLIFQQPEDLSFKLKLVNFYDRTNSDNQLENYLNDLIHSQPEMEKLRIDLAMFYRKKNRDDAMIRILKQAITVMPEKYKAYELLAKHYFGENEIDKALEVLDLFTEKMPNGEKFVKARLFQAHILFQEDKMEDALKVVEKILEQNFTDVRAHSIKGDILDDRKDFSGAINEYKSAMDWELQNVLILLKLASSYFMNNLLGLSEATYKKVLEINPKVYQARYGLVEIYQRKGWLEDAKEQLNIVLDRYPDTKEALYSLGDIALKKDDLKTAKRCYERLLELEPGLSIVHYKNGLLSLGEKRIKDAIIYFEKSLTIDPDFVPALNQLINILKSDEAIKRCKQQINKSPRNSDYHILLGKLYASKRDFHAGQKNFEMALDLNPESHEARINLLRLVQSSGSVDKTIKKYRNQLVQNPDNLGIAMLLAGFFELKGDYNKAIDFYEYVLNKNPNLEVAANNLAFSYAEYGSSEENLAKAEELIRPLIGKYRDNPHILDTGAWIFYRKGDFERARDLLLDVKGKVKSVPIIGYHLGMIYLQLGDKLKAKKFLKLALSGKQKFSGKEEAEKILTRLSYKG